MHNTLARIEPVASGQVNPAMQAVFDAQAKKWGAPLLNHRIYARRPSIFQGVRAMWAALGRRARSPFPTPQAAEVALEGYRTVK